MGFSRLFLSLNVAFCQDRAEIHRQRKEKKNSFKGRGEKTQTPVHQRLHPVSSGNYVNDRVPLFDGWIGRFRKARKDANVIRAMLI